MTKYEDIFDAVLGIIETEHTVFPLEDVKIAELLTKKLSMDISAKVVFNARRDGDIPRCNVRRWLRRHNISPIQIERINANTQTAQ